MRGNTAQTKVHYQGSEDDFIVFVNDPEELKKWRNDKSIPLAEVVAGWKVFVTHKSVLPIPLRFIISNRISALPGSSLSIGSLPRGWKSRLSSSRPLYFALSS